VADTYAYRVRDQQGSLLTGEIVADNRDSVLSRLREMQYVPLEVKVKRQGLSREISLRPGRVKLKHLAVFSRQFATMVNSGLPLLRTMAILEEQSESTTLKKVLTEMRLEVEQGSSLSGAMAKHPKAFSNLYVAMCRSGETAGTLDQVLLRLADTVEREVSLRQRVKSAMTYPVVVLALVVLILAAMLLFVVPTFETLYEDLGGTLPVPTRILLAISRGFRSYFPWVVLAFALLVFGFTRWKRTDAGRRVVDRVKLKIPIFGSLFHKSSLSRFARTLGALSRSGVPILQSLDIVTETVNNSVVADAIRDVQASVKGGESLAMPMSRHEVFPPMVVQMMAVGEETGALDSMLDKIADFYDDEVTSAVDSLTSLIEPLMIAVVGGAVGLIVISLYLPLFKIIELIQ
jgi:type IV pilus assembly protein PilC